MRKASFEWRVEGAREVEDVSEEEEQERNGGTGERICPTQS